MTQKPTFTRRAMIAAVGALIAATAFIGSSEAGAQTVEEIKEKGKLTVGVLVDFPPFGILDYSGKPDGYDPALARLLASKMGLEAELVPVSGPNRVPFLVTGKVDVLIAALGITKERAKLVDYSQPSATVDQVLYAAKDKQIDGMEDLTGLNVGVARGSAQDITLTKQAPKGTTIQRFDDDPSTLQALLSGQVDAIVMSTLMIKEVEKASSVETFEIKFAIQHLVHGIAVRKGETELLQWIDKTLAEVKESGELNELHKKWVGTDFVPTEKPEL